MTLSSRRARPLGIIACALLLARVAVAQGQVLSGNPAGATPGAPGAAPPPAVTYTPMRRPGVVAPAPSRAVPPPAAAGSKSPPAAAAAAPSATARPPAAPVPVPAVPSAPVMSAPPAAAYPSAPVMSAPPVTRYPTAPVMSAPPVTPSPSAPVMSAPPGLSAPGAQPQPYAPDGMPPWAGGAPSPAMPYGAEPSYSPRSPRGASATARARAAGTDRETLAARATPAAGAHRNTLGLGFDVGVPEGINVGFVVSPADWLRLTGALGTNTASLGYRGGVTFVPVGWGPSFTFEVGHCNQAAMNDVLRAVFKSPKWANPYVQELGYTYVNGHVGFDYVRGNLTVFLHGGYTYLSGTVRGDQPVMVDTKTQTVATIAEDGKISAHSLSAKLGMSYLFGGL